MTVGKTIKFLQYIYSRSSRERTNEIILNSMDLVHLAISVSLFFIYGGPLRSNLFIASVLKCAVGLRGGVRSLVL